MLMKFGYPREMCYLCDRKESCFGGSGFFRACRGTFCATFLKISAAVCEKVAALREKVAALVFQIGVYVLKINILRL